MSLNVLNHSPDLKRLRDEGYFIQIQSGFLILRNVPYVTKQKQIQKGNLISCLNLAGDVTKAATPHTIYFDGEYPCKADGSPITEIQNSSKTFDLGNGLKAKHLFSCKPAHTGRYEDYYDKMTTYASILSGPASVIDPNISPKTFTIIDDEDDCIFNYTETASDRAGIGALTDLLRDEKVAIIGLGGTGSYVLDFVAKTPVKEIKLFDNDEFLQHNAFRAPGAPSIEELSDAPMKVEYLSKVYSRMHRNIIPYPELITKANIDSLEGSTFVFLCIDGSTAKEVIVQKLEDLDLPFIDVGMGLELVNGSLGGILRVTASTPEKRNHVHEGRIPFEGGDQDDLYKSNIQIADLNALNAVMAVIKWKKLRGFYSDLEKEFHSTYTTDGNMLLNGDIGDAV